MLLYSDMVSAKREDGLDTYAVRITCCADTHVDMGNPIRICHKIHFTLIAFEIDILLALLII